jgi:hypothetical protein
MLINSTINWENYHKMLNYKEYIPKTTFFTKKLHNKLLIEILILTI